MLKKSICIILVPLILINSLCCFSKVYLFQEDIDKISEGDNIIVMTQDGKAYDITVAKIEEEKIHGIVSDEGQEYPVVIHADDISMIQFKETDTSSTILFGLTGIVVFTGMVITYLIINKVNN